MLRNTTPRCGGPGAPGSTTADAAVRPSPDVRHAMDQGGLVLFHTGTGKIFQCNAAGALIWHALMRREPASVVEAEIGAQCGVAPEVAKDRMATFVADLRSWGLVLRCGGAK